jgi:predicted transcriptional regulator
MPASTTMTIRIPNELKSQLEQLAHETRRSKSFLAADAVAAYVAREMEIIEGIKQGIADMEAGNLIDHEDAMAELDAALAEAKTRKRA